MAFGNTLRHIPATRPVVFHPRLIIGVLLLLVVAIALPFVTSGYLVFQLTLTLVYAIAILGLNMLTGYSGQISLGHGAFYAIGAYTTAILMTRFGVDYWWTIPIAGLTCLIVGFLFGLPALRLEGLYLALATFALAAATPQILKYKGISAWTGGVQGIVIIKPDPPHGLPVNADQWLYLFTLAITIAMFVLAWNLLRGRIGRAMIAIRDHPVAAAAMGVDISLFKSLMFGVSALYTGIAGSLGAIAVQFVSPDAFNILLSISLLLGVVVGGLGSIPGVIFGALFIEFVPDFAGQVSKAAPWAVYGLLLIVCMYVAPSGMAGLARRTLASIRKAGRARPLA